MMERFVASLRNPPVKEKLRAVLFAGKGVFRGFKDILKSSPEVENLWFAFKEKALRREIIGWDNTLCDSWGAEKIGAEPEETDELVCSDFTFREGQDDSDEVFVQRARALCESELKEMYDAESAKALSLLDRVPVMLAGKSPFYTLTVKTAEGDFAGFIRVSPFPEGARKTVIITDFYVFSAWRGLGIGKSLFARCMDMLKAKGIAHVFALSVHIPVFFEQVMLRSGFRRISAGFLADI
jgi:acetyltransferase, GNAT family